MTTCGSQLVGMLEEFNNNNTKTAVFKDTTVEHDNDLYIEYSPNRFYRNIWEVE